MPQAKKKKEKQFAKFIMHNVPNAPFYFTSYSRDGNVVYLKNGENDNGKDVKASIMFPKGKRVITIPMGKKDQNGKLFVDFIRNSPYCKGSDLCEGEGLFFEFNPERDAKIVMDEEKITLQATYHAMNLAGEDLVNLAAYCGITNEDNEDIMRSAVFNFAKMKPREYNEIAETSDIEYVGLIRSCVALKIIKKRGYAYDLITESGSTEYLTDSEDKLASRLRAEKPLYEALKNRIKQAKANA